MTELWTIEQVAAYLRIQPGSARGTLSRWGVSAYDYQPHPTSGRPQARFEADKVRTAEASRQRRARSARADYRDAG